MTELLSILYKLRIFTSDELSEALKGKVKSVEALLARYKQQGWIVAIRRNTYFATTSKRWCDWWRYSTISMTGLCCLNLLFEDKEMVNRITFHPMALWKTRSRWMFFCKFWKKLLFCLVFWFPQLYIQYMDYKTENRLWVNIW